MKAIKKFLFIFLPGIFPLLIHAQSIQSFNKIRVASNASVILKQGEVLSIVLDEENSQDASRYFTINNDGWLVISGNPDEDIYVTVPSINKVEISGTGSLESEGTFNAPELELLIIGVGQVEMNIVSNYVKAVISGAGKIEFAGTADSIDIDISGSGKIDAENLKVRKCSANISGSGKCLVDVTEELNTNISGSGSVYYATPPAIINNNVSGSGKVGDIYTAGTDTTRITLGKTKILIVDEEGKDVRFSFKDGFSTSDKVKSHWAGFELGVNLLMNDDFSNNAPEGYDFLDQRPEKSIAVHFNLADYEVQLYRRHIMLVTGIGFTINNYRFNSDSYLAPDSSNVTAIGGPAFTLSKNKLVTDYINIPLLIEFNTSENKKRTFHFATGVIGGIKVASHLKLVEDSGDNEVKNKIYDDFNVNPWRADATVRLGYRNFTVFGSYGLTSFFKTDKDPELHTLTVGLRLVGW